MAFDVPIGRDRSSPADPGIIFLRALFRAMGDRPIGAEEVEPSFGLSGWGGAPGNP